MTEQSEHLSNAQIENYGIRTSGAGPDAAQRDEPQRVNHQSIDGLRINDQPTNDQSLRDRQIDDRQIDDQRVEAHLADCASCRNRLFGFHRSLFTGVADSPEADPSGKDTARSGYSPSDQRSSDSKVEGSRPTDSALADSKFANPDDPAGPQVRTVPTPECPSTEALRELAAGLTPDDLAPALTRHAATCDHCGPLLRAFTEDFSDDFSPEEQAVLNNLQSASAEWQKNTAREMLAAARASAASAAGSAEVGSSSTAAAVKPDKNSSAGRPVSTAPDHKPFFWKWTLVPAAAASLAATVIVGVVSFGILAAKRDTPEKVEVLLAQAYTENRQLAMRFPNTPFATMHITRGSEQSRFSQSPSLLKAEGIIGQHQQGAQEGIGWLQAGAKADILDGRPGAAITVLSQALAKYPDSISLAMNLAVAHFELAETSNDAQDYKKAQVLLTKVLAREPGNCVALFNRAVVLGRLRLTELAVSDWKATLRCESDPAWAAEARDRLEALTAARAKH